MTVQRVCDKCGEVLDPSESFWTVTMSQQAPIPGDEAAPPSSMPVVMAGNVVQFDFHDDHVPEEIKQQ